MVQKASSFYFLVSDMLSFIRALYPITLVYQVHLNVNTSSLIVCLPLVCMVMQVLADSVGIPCRLVKGQQYTGCDDVAMNFVRIDDGR